MCTGFVKKGKDLLFGFNLDIDPEVWNFDLYMNDNCFTVGITIGKTLYYTHGVNSRGQFANLPYSNDFNTENNKAHGKKERIDLLVDRYIRNKYSYNDVLDILHSKTIVNVPSQTMHTLLADSDGHIIIIEPGYGYKQVEDTFAVIANFPLLTDVRHFEPYFGKDRYDKAFSVLSNANDDFTADDGIRLLKEVRQEGKWATRISFVYSSNEHCVYYCLNNEFGNVKKYFFKN